MGQRDKNVLFPVREEKYLPSQNLIFQFSSTKVVFKLVLDS